jgi:hypothetical protein
MKLTGAPLLVLGLLAGTGCGQKPKPEARPKFTVGKETTYLTEPLDEQGYVDYAAALNKRLSQGVTPQNNANVLLWKAFGPHPGLATMPPDYFKCLGISEPPERGDYFIDLPHYTRERLKADPNRPPQELYERLSHAALRPWTPKEYPEIAAWLKAIKKPLDVAVEASKRPHYFNPLVPKKTKTGPSGLPSVSLAVVSECREICQALETRALLRARQGRFDDAWQDLLACHRFARLVAHGGTLIEGLTGIAIDSTAVKADLAFLTSPGLTPQRLRGCLADLQKLRPFPLMADKFDLGERLMTLDSILKVARYGFDYLADHAFTPPSKLPDRETRRQLDSIDWDIPLRTANGWYDRLATAMRIKDRAKRDRELGRLEEVEKALRKALNGGEVQKKILLAEDAAEARSKGIGDGLICLLLPAYRKIQEAADRAEQSQANLRVAFALALYCAEHGRYPAKLDALAPKYLPAVPGDLFSGKALVYKPTDKGYLLYSVGPDGRDDGGRGQDDDPPGDDLAVRMPLPELPAK